jgi:hypothetical protein
MFESPYGRRTYVKLSVQKELKQIELKHAKHCKVDETIRDDNRQQGKGLQGTTKKTRDDKKQQGTTRNDKGQRGTIRGRGRSRNNKG